MTHPGRWAKKRMQRGVKAEKDRVQRQIQKKQRKRSPTKLKKPQGGNGAPAKCTRTKRHASRVGICLLVQQRRDSGSNLWGLGWNSRETVET